MKDQRSFSQKLNDFLMKDSTFILLIMGAAAAIFAGTYMYIKLGTGAFNEISIVAMLQDGLDGGDYAAATAFATGFLIARIKEYIAYAKKQYKGVGRAMKIGKEGIMGLLAALEQYENKDRKAEVEKNLAVAQFLSEQINQIPGLRSEVIQDEAGRAIYRARVFVDPDKAGMTAAELDAKLKDGDPTIRCRTEFMSLGKLDFDPRPLVEGDKELIVEKLKKIMKG